MADLRADLSTCLVYLGVIISNGVLLSLSQAFSLHPGFVLTPMTRSTIPPAVYVVGRGRSGLLFSRVYLSAESSAETVDQEMKILENPQHTHTYTPHTRPIPPSVSFSSVLILTARMTGMLTPR